MYESDFIASQKWKFRNTVKKNNKISWQMYRFKVEFKLVHFINPHKFAVGKRAYKGKEIKYDNIYG